MTDIVQEPSKVNTHISCKHIFTPSITVAGVIKQTTSHISRLYVLYSSDAWHQFDTMSRHKHVRTSCSILCSNSICLKFCESTVMEYRVINLPFIKDLLSAIGSYSFCCYIRWISKIDHSKPSVLYNARGLKFSVLPTRCIDVWVAEQTAIIYLYSINWLVCITERESVYCAVRTGSLYIIQVMCFVWIWEQTAIISLYSIIWLVCITDMESVYCAVRAECLKPSRLILNIKAPAAQPLLQITTYHHLSPLQGKASISIPLQSQRRAGECVNLLTKSRPFSNPLGKEN